MDRFWDTIQDLIDNDTLIILGVLLVALLQAGEATNIVLGGLIGYLAREAKDATKR